MWSSANATQLAELLLLVPAAALCPLPHLRTVVLFFSHLAVRRAFLPFAVCSALVLAGCGGSDTSATPSTGAGDDSDAGRVKLTQCLRDNGVDVPDNPGAGGGAGAGDIDRDKIQAAMEGPCKDLQQGAFGNIAGGDRQEMQDAFQKFSQCMRDEGVDVPELGSGDGPPAGGNRLNQDDPDVKAAMEQCQDELPQGGPGAGQ